MANTLTTNPIILSGVQTSYKAAVASILGTLFTLRVEKIYWFQPATVGDEALIINPQSGQTLLRLRCEVAGQSQVIDWTANPKLWQDFGVNQLDSGSIEIYTR